LAAVLVVAVVLKLGLYVFNRRLGRKIDSTALLATAADSRNDAISTSAVLLAAVLEMKFGWQLDGFMGLAVAAFILYSGVMLAKDTISPLLGETASPELQQLIINVVNGEEKILGYHDLMVHDYGPGQRFASIHVEMDCREDPLECHERIDELERLCLEQHRIHLVIHYDPVVTDDPELDLLKEMTTRLLKQRDKRLSLHDFRMVQGTGHTNLIFDVALPASLRGQEKEIKKSLETGLNENSDVTYHTVITFDIASFNQT
jgi:divalent metal cation (Fe/Co/Zn/Cd) transporter